MIPPEVMAESRQRADELIAQGKPVSKAGLVLVISIWLIGLAVVVWIVVKVVRAPG
jgi:hypothetical protein